MQDRQVEIHDFLNVRTLDLDRDLRSVVQLRLMHLRNGSAGNRLERKGGKQTLDRLPKFGLNDCLGQRPIEGRHAILQFGEFKVQFIGNKIAA